MTPAGPTTSGRALAPPLLLLLAVALACHLFVAQCHMAAATSDGEDQATAITSNDANDEDDATLEEFLRANLSHRRAALLGLRRADLEAKARSERAISASNNNNNSNRLGLRRIQRRPELEDLRGPRLLARKRRADTPTSAALAPPNTHELLYVVSPVSEQVLPVQRAKLAQGLTSLAPLPGGNYETGLRKSARFGALTAAGLLLPETTGLEAGCRAVRTSVQLTKDELDARNGQLVRRCSGRVALNACEGACTSSIQPSIKAPSGFVKKCACCNEGAFKRVQVRLDTCYLLAAAGQQLEPGGYMDLEVEEPVDCKCRACDSLL